MNYDKILCDIFFIDDWHFNKSNLEKYKTHYKKKDKYQNIINYIESRYNDSFSFKETMYRIKYNIDIRPVCKACGKPVEFLGKGGILFRTFCCNSCSANDKDTIKKKWETDRKNHNGKIGWIESNKSKEKIKKRENTIIKKYGSLNNASKVFSERAKNTLIKRYGTKNILEIPEFKEKSYNTKKRNNSFAVSIPEDNSFIMLAEKYNNVIRQYRSELYPFNCDFYIPEKDLYIECNYNWTHGKKPFEGTIEDNRIVALWESKNTAFYNNAIKTWTVRDPLKRETAKKNNLNYLEFFNIEELKEWLEKN